MKKYKLPKEFGEKWLTALRSGDYVQGIEHLLSYEQTEDECGYVEENKDKKTYCCLGVACALTEAPEKFYADLSFVSSSYGFEYEELTAAGYPKELAGESGFPETLAMLNDSIQIEQIHFSTNFSDVKFRKEPIVGETYKLTFPEIADFIEDNVEFY